MPTESGYSNQKKYGEAQFKTIQTVGSDKWAAPSVPKHLFSLAPDASIVNAAVDDDDYRFVIVELTGHGAREKDVLKISTGNLTAWEFDIVEVIDADLIKIYNVGALNGVPEILQSGDMASVMRWVTPSSESNGITGVWFKKGGVNVPVSFDTSNPPDSTPLPTNILDNQGNILNFATLNVKSGLVGNLVDFSVNPVDNVAYVDVNTNIGATEASIVQIFMSSGEPLWLAIGGVGFEVDKIIIIPGGNGVLEFRVPANSRVSVRAVNAVTVNTGILIMNFIG